MKIIKEESIVRIAACDDCSLPLPLRSAKRGEVEATWECCSCGARFHGVIAEDSPKKQKRNVRRVFRR
jgi:hypothetical protein